MRNAVYISTRPTSGGPTNRVKCMQIDSVGIYVTVYLQPEVENEDSDVQASSCSSFNHDNQFL